MNVSAPFTVGVIAEHRLPHLDPTQRLTVAAAQLGGPWLDVDARMDRVVAATEVAAGAGCRVVAFPETYLSGYPFWLPRTNGARFDEPTQKACYAYYLANAVEIGGSEHRRLEELSHDCGVELVVGVTERVGGTAYASLLTIDPSAGLVGHHRKLVPTYDERLVWGNGDGAGLRVHPVGAARIGALNCWENWMPQARQALYAQGEHLHVGAWPGSHELTSDITRFIAKEGRVFSLAVGGIIARSDIPDDFPLAEELRAASTEMPFNGGSAIAGPDGAWIIDPVCGREGLLVADLDLAAVAAERSTFDPTGHYSRPDVFHTTVDRTRWPTVAFIEGGRPSD
ncbi:nitrilase [Mycolicibacterium madagascariense]|uniref:Nitrilase n=1 Tax=Mycolicibacterium madagascariense TaxID=212765 RepID=A0A7I7XHD9_9MYCO|nr:carbon-nitrogen hydrolase family protein [Mycolicibacterium madagascariense]BBZ28609.1 nitrilase [Mycolicibacterium madagascariense]